MRASHRSMDRSNPHINFSLLDCPECKYLDERGTCGLQHQKCSGSSCTLQQSREEETRRREKWCARMNTLSDRQQEAIAQKYYGGKRPWREKI